MSSDSESDLFGSVVYTYTRKQAIDDGVLIDVSEMAEEIGFAVPVAVTASLWHDYINLDPDTLPAGQSAEGRLWDTLWMARIAARTRKDADRVRIRVLYLMPGGKMEHVDVIVAVSADGPRGSPVVTIMRPEDD